MYNITAIKEGLKELVGFREEEGFTLGADLTTSTSGLFINDHHPLLRLSTLESIRPEGLTLPLFLATVRDNAIPKLLNDVMTKKQISHTVKENLGETVLFDSASSLRNTETKRGRFVGIMLRPRKSENLNTLIKQVSLQLVEAQTLPIYLFHTSQKDYLDSTVLNYTKATSTQWFDVNFDPLKYSTDDTDAGGSYIIGYYEDDLTSTNSAIYKNHDLSKRPCGGCNRINALAYNTWSSYVNISTIFIPQNKLVDGILEPDPATIQTTARNFGLNLKISFTCDITDFILQYTRPLIYPLLDRIAIDLLKHVEMAPTRKNGITDTMANESYTAIHGLITENAHIKARGLQHDYDDKISALSFEYSRLDPVCVPCTNKGIRWNSKSTNKYV